MQGSPAGRIRMQHEHCWHDTGAMVLTQPPKVVERCCHCGETQAKDQSLFMDGKVHGPYMRGWRAIDEGVTIPVIKLPGNE